MTDFGGYIADPDVRDLAHLTAALRSTYESERSDPWVDSSHSPFSWIKPWPSSRQVGTIGEKIVAAWCTANGFAVQRSPDSDCDRIIAGHRIEIKLSTLWKGGVYKFQQIRDQDYEYIFALGISPFDAHAWILPKTMLMTRPAGLKRQHGGARGTDTDWLSVKAGQEHDWMRPFGGTLAAVREILSRLGAGRPI